MCGLRVFYVWMRVSTTDHLPRVHDVFTEYQVCPFPYGIYTKPWCGSRSSRIHNAQPTFMLSFSLSLSGVFSKPHWLKDETWSVLRVYRNDDAEAGGREIPGLGNAADDVRVLKARTSACFTFRQQLPRGDYAGDPSSVKRDPRALRELSLVSRDPNDSVVLAVPNTSFALTKAFRFRRQAFMHDHSVSLRCCIRTFERCRDTCRRPLAEISK